MLPQLRRKRIPFRSIAPRLKLDRLELEAFESRMEAMKRERMQAEAKIDRIEEDIRRLRAGQ